jgi:FMN phosphatase YigB (HAD superfamily)
MPKLPSNEWKHVSFDIFDTLVVRETVLPKGTLLLAKRNSKHKTPLAWRLGVEHALRITNGVLNQGRETSFTQISNLVSEKSIDAEKLTDKAGLKARPLGLELLNEAISIGAKISYISDTTYTSIEIEGILQEAGIPIAGKIFVSSEHRATKREGDLFDIVRESVNIKVSDWLHVGDDLRADGTSPKSRGISVLHTPKQIEVLNKLIHEDHLESLLTKNNLSGLITLGILCSEAETNNEFVDDDYYRLGTSIIGPLVTGFAEWIFSQVKHDDQIAFLGRDGHLPKKVFDIMNPLNDQSSYKQVSRRNLLVPAWLGIRKNPEEFIRRVPQLKHETINEFLIRLGLDGTGSSTANTINERSLPEMLQAEGFQSQASQEQLAISGLISELSNANVIVDVGWRATLQEAIQILSGLNVQGLYLSTSVTSFIGAPDAKGWLTNSGSPRKHAKVIRQSIGLIERAFSEQVPSQLGGNSIQSNFKVDERITAIQEGAIRFAQLWKEKSVKYGVEMEKDTAVSGLRAVMMNPRPVDLNVIGSISNEHAPSVHAKYEETLIPKFDEKKLKLRDFSSPSECDANWPIGYTQAVLNSIGKNGKRSGSFEVAVWQVRGNYSKAKSFGVKNSLSLVLNKFR